MQEPGENWELLNGLKYVRPGGGWEPHENLTIHAKTEVNGANANPMYQMMKAACPRPTVVMGQKSRMFWEDVRTDDINWNFEKFLIDRRGYPRYRFHSAAWDHGRVVEPHLTSLLAETAPGPSNVPQRI